MTSPDINKNVTLPPWIVSEIIKSHLSMLNVKMRPNYQKNFEKSGFEHKTLHGKLTEYVVLTIQTVSIAFYV